MWTKNWTLPMKRSMTHFAKNLYSRHSKQGANSRWQKSSFLYKIHDFNQNNEFLPYKMIQEVVKNIFISLWITFKISRESRKFMCAYLVQLLTRWTDFNKLFATISVPWHISRSNKLGQGFILKLFSWVLDLIWWRYLGN